MSKTLVNVVLLVISIGLAVVGQLAMKAGMNRVTHDGEDPLKPGDLAHPVNLLKRMVEDGPWALAGIVLYAISAVFWLIVLSRVPLSVAYPIVAVGYVVVVFYSWLVFKEEVGWISWVGLALIVIGVVLTAQGLKPKAEQNGNESSIRPPTAQVSIEGGTGNIPAGDETGIGSPDQL
ncbi:MAG: EamA family transporter [Actinobacteria bacterium]|nr:EamA family transporter [Actinomycetota bacterium]MBU1945250.1 EamA family transporter [Actinomycetota bacterium]MBU2687822.1 EamA family transporter [Actinomycetota bacterium]